MLDSVVLIDQVNGVAAATRYLLAHASGSAISVVTRAEVLAGFDADVALLAPRVLDRFPALPITVDMADRAAVLAAPTDGGRPTRSRRHWRPTTT